MDGFGLAVVGIVGALLLFQLQFHWRARRQRGKPAPDGYRDLMPRGWNGTRALLYFHSAHCGPCRALSPLVDRKREGFPELIKVDVTAEPELAREFGVMGTPTFVQVRKDHIARVVLGAVSEKRLDELLTTDT